MINLKDIKVGDKVLLNEKSRYNTGSKNQLPMGVIGKIKYITNDSQIEVTWSRQSNFYTEKDLDLYIQPDIYEIV